MAVQVHGPQARVRVCEGHFSTFKPQTEETKESPPEFVFYRMMLSMKKWMHYLLGGAGEGERHHLSPAPDTECCF